MSIKDTSTHHEAEILQKIQAGDEAFEEIRKAENEWINKRRKKAGIDDEALKGGTVGLGLSGGGIRSATFNLGLLQAMERYGILKNVDYLSTVSGGGYIGSCFTWFMSKLKQFPFGTSRDDYEKLGGAVLAWLRSHGKFLTPGEGLNVWALASAVLAGMLLTLLVLVPVFIGMFYLLSLRPEFMAKVPRFLDSFIKLGEGNQPVIVLFLYLGVGVLALFLAATLLFAILTGLSAMRKPNVQKWMRKCAGGLLKYGVLLVAVGTIPIVFHFFKGVFEEWIPAAMSSVSLTGILSMFAGGRGRKGGNEVKGYRSFLLSIGLSLLVYGLFLWFYCLASHWNNLPLLIGGIVLSIFIGVFANINHVSMHRFYRNRLMQAYMPGQLNIDHIARTGDKKPGGISTVEVGNPDQCTFEDINITAAPYHIVNTNIQTIGSSDYRLSGRGGDNFIFSPKYCGSDATTFIPNKDWPNKKYKIDLATAFAVSGAAVDPNTYATRSRPLSFLMTLLNIRLGYWIKNPNPKHSFKLFNVFPMWYYYLFAELFGKGLNEKQKHIHLSDGGHFENLGLYELIRRQCKCIIISDAGADKDWNFNDLAKVQEMVRLDFGAKINLDVTDLIPSKNDDFQKSYVNGWITGTKDTNIRLDVTEMVQGKRMRSKKAFVHGEVIYRNGEKADLIYIKTTLVDGLTEDLYSYAHGHPAFPDQSTMDQFFDEPQFEAYRELGFQLGRLLCKRYEVCEDNMKRFVGMVKEEPENTGDGQKRKTSQKSQKKQSVTSTGTGNDSKKSANKNVQMKKSGTGKDKKKVINEEKTEKTKSRKEEINKKDTKKSRPKKKE